MRYKNKEGRRYLHLLITLTFLICVVGGESIAAFSIYVQRDKKTMGVFAVSKPAKISQAPEPQDDAELNQSSGPGSKKLKPGNKKPEKALEPSEDLNGTSASPRQEKEQQALSLVEGVLLSTHKVALIEYRILAEVEAATLLWGTDTERSISILRSIIKAVRGLLNEKNEATVVSPHHRSKEQRVWFLALRKIAALKPELLQGLMLEGIPIDKAKEAIKEWTDEARALMTVAEEQLEKDPKLAAHIVEQSLSLGRTDWVSFLIRLSQRDSAEAERLAIRIIDRVLDSSTNALELRDILRFVSAHDRSLRFKEYYFKSLATRLRRDIRLDAPLQDIKDGLRIARGIIQVTAADFPHLQQEFVNIAFAFEALFKERSLPLPAPPRRIAIDMSAVTPAKPSDTQEIKDTLAKVIAMSDFTARDLEYQKLALKAAANADAGLAEEIMGKIKDEGVRRDCSARIYSPLVKKAIGESDWALAQNLAAKIAEPLARALAFESIARAMLSAKAEKQAVIDLYADALAKLYTEFTTERVVKAVLLLARALYRLDQERGLEAIKSFAYVANKLTLKDTPVEETELESSLTIWVRYTNHALTADEIMNLPDMIADTFKDLAGRDLDNALAVSMSLRDQGMYSFAQLAIARALLEEAKKAQPPARVKRAAKE